MVVADLARITDLPVARQRLVLKEIVARGLLQLDGDIIRLPLFDEMQKRDATSVDRVRKWREKQLQFGVTGVTGNADVTQSETPVTGQEDIEIPLRTPKTSSSPYSGGNSAGLNGTAAPVAWAEKIRTESDGLGDLDLAALSPAQRFIVARRYALEFANCTRSEGQNAAKARSIAAGIANLTDRLNRDRVDVSVRDYLAAARMLWRRGGEAPHYAPFEVYAELVEAKP